MRLWYRKGSRGIAFLLVCALAQVYIQFGFAQQPPQFIARLTATRNGQPILVNGNSTPVGSAITPGSIIETGADQSATIDLDVGVLEVAQNTSLRLDFEEGRVKVTITRGCAVLRTKENIDAEIASPDATIEKAEDRKKANRLVGCFLNGQATSGQAAESLMTAAPTVATGGGGGLGAGAWWAIGGGIIAAVILPIIAFRGDNPSPS